MMLFKQGESVETLRKKVADLEQRLNELEKKIEQKPVKKRNSKRD
jgi:phage shock protein A